MKQRKTVLLCMILVVIFVLAGCGESRQAEAVVASTADVAAIATKDAVAHAAKVEMSLDRSGLSVEARAHAGKIVQLEGDEQIDFDADGVKETFSIDPGGDHADGHSCRITVQGTEVEQLFREEPQDIYAVSLDGETVQLLVPDKDAWGNATMLVFGYRDGLVRGVAKLNGTPETLEIPDTMEELVLNGNVLYLYDGDELDFDLDGQRETILFRDDPSYGYHMQIGDAGEVRLISRSDQFKDTAHYETAFAVSLDGKEIQVLADNAYTTDSGLLNAYLQIYRYAGGQTSDLGMLGGSPEDIYIRDGSFQTVDYLDNIQRGTMIGVECKLVGKDKITTPEIWPDWAGAKALNTNIENRYEDWYDVGDAVTAMRNVPLFAEKGTGNAGITIKEGSAAVIQGISPVNSHEVWVCVEDVATGEQGWLKTVNEHEKTIYYACYMPGSSESTISTELFRGLNI